MKRSTTAALLLLLASPALGQLNPICGDCNQDDRVTAADSLLAAQAAAGLTTLLLPEVCDVDEDGALSSLDALMITQFSADVLPTLECSGQLPPISASEPLPSLDPATAAGNCVQGQSMGQGWSFSILAGPSFQAPGIPRGMTANDLATHWRNVINAGTSNWVATRSGNCIQVESTTGVPAVLQIVEGGVACIPDLGTACTFGVP